MTKRLGFLFIFGVLSIFLRGQGEVTFTAETDAREVVEGNVFELFFTLKNANGQMFRPPSFNGLKVVSGPSRSTSTSIINGKMSSEMSFSYTMLAEKPGKYVIRPASIRAGNKTLSSNPVQVTVVKARKPKPGTKGLQNTGEEIFITAELSDSVIFVGQQLLVDYKVYTTKNIEAYNLVSESDYGGVFFQEIRRFNKQTMRVAINGTQYVSQVVKRVAVFPQQAGVLEIEPFVLQLGIENKNSRGRRRGFFFSRDLVYRTMSSKSVKIEVRSLPADAPDDFCGGVGEYTMSASVSPANLSTDDALSVKMYLRGNGDPKQVLPQKIDFPDAFDVYDPKVLQEEVNETGGEVSHIKEFEWVALPEETGSYTVRPTVSYFNPDSMKYLKLAINPSSINVRRGTNRPRERPEQSANDSSETLLPIKITGNLKPVDRQFFLSPIFWLLFFLPIIVFAYSFHKKKKEEAAENMDPLLKKRLRARKAAEKHLKKAKAHLDAGAPKQFYDEISDATFGYVGDKLNIPLSELSKSNLSEKLKSGGVSEDLIDRFLEIIKTCEMALFAGKDNAEAMAATYDSTREVLSEMENIF